MTDSPAEAVGVPHRVQLSRQKGWRMPENTISGARPGRLGNPFRIGDFGIPDAKAAVQRHEEWLDGRVVGPPVPDLAPYRGKNIGCWCRLDQPCHVDNLLRRANPPTPVQEA